MRLHEPRDPARRLGDGAGSGRASRRRTKGAVEAVSGKVKQGVGKLIDNEQMEAEGRAKELKGEARQKANH